VLTWHSAKALPSARQAALGKEFFADEFFAECSLPSVALEKAFAECGLHSAKNQNPIVGDIKLHSFLIKECPSLRNKSLGKYYTS